MFINYAAYAILSIIFVKYNEIDERKIISYKKNIGFHSGVRYSIYLNLVIQLILKIIQNYTKPVYIKHAEANY